MPAIPPPPPPPPAPPATRAPSRRQPLWPPSPRDGGHYSADHKLFWDGAAWRPLPANQETGIPAYAWFGRRVWGYLVDVFLASLLSLIAVALIQATNGNEYNPPSFAETALQLYSLVFAMYMMAMAWFWGAYGQTPGQMAVGIEVARLEDGGRLPPGRAFIRTGLFWMPGLLANFAPELALLTPIGLAWAAMDARGQGWHDRLARSVVIMHRCPRRLHPAVTVLLGSAGLLLPVVLLIWLVIAATPTP